MRELGSRQSLRNGIIEAFSAQDEIYKIIIFGKEAAGKDDLYSDIDLVVYSNDPFTTWQHYRAIFASLAPVVGTLPLGSSPDFIAEMLLLEGYSPYQKIDFSIGVGLDLALTSVKTVYERPEKNTPPLSALPVIETRYDVRFHLADQLFSIPRFTKCLFRRDIDMYRRWSGFMNRALVLQFEQKFGWEVETQKSKLYSYETEKLMAHLSQEERQRIFGILPPDGSVEIARSALNAVDLIIVLSREKAGCLNVSLDNHFIEIFQGFLYDEIERFL